MVILLTDGCSHGHSRLASQSGQSHALSARQPGQRSQPRISRLDVQPNQAGQLFAYDRTSVLSVWQSLFACQSSEFIFRLVSQHCPLPATSAFSSQVPTVAHFCASPSSKA